VKNLIIATLFDAIERRDFGRILYLEHHDLEKELLVKWLVDVFGSKLTLRKYLSPSGKNI
jgi:hypothetical protein